MLEEFWTALLAARGMTAAPSRQSGLVAEPLKVRTCARSPSSRVPNDATPTMSILPSELPQEGYLASRKGTYELLLRPSGLSLRSCLAAPLREAFALSHKPVVRPPPWARGTS